MKNKLEKYEDGMCMRHFERIESVSRYNRNYYTGILGDLLFAESDDDDTTAWYLISGVDAYFIGYSCTSDGDQLQCLDEPWA